jgi:hypothetical protein
LHFGNIHKRIKETLKTLNTVQQAPASLFTHEQETSLKLDLENLLIKEESLWCSKSGETWLTCKDLNTKYFHTSTLIRRRSNAVNFLKLDDGRWVSSRAEIAEKFLAHFTTLFTSTNPPLRMSCWTSSPPSLQKRIMSFCVLLQLKRKLQMPLIA